MGLTKSVQPYCRLAIITMQMMPKINWPQRVASEAVARDEIVSVVTVTSIPALLIEGTLRIPRFNHNAINNAFPPSTPTYHRWLEQARVPKEECLELHR